MLDVKGAGGPRPRAKDLLAPVWGLAARGRLGEVGESLRGEDPPSGDNRCPW